LSPQKRVSAFCFNDVCQQLISPDWVVDTGDRKTMLDSYRGVLKTVVLWDEIHKGVGWDTVSDIDSDRGRMSAYSFNDVSQVFIPPNNDIDEGDRQTSSDCYRGPLRTTTDPLEWDLVGNINTAHWDVPPQSWDKQN